MVVVVGRGVQRVSQGWPRTRSSRLVTFAMGTSRWVGAAQDFLGAAFTHHRPWLVRILEAWSLPLGHSQLFLGKLPRVKPTPVPRAWEEGQRVA